MNKIIMLLSVLIITTACSNSNETVKVKSVQKKSSNEKVVLNQEVSNLKNEIKVGKLKLTWDLKSIENIKNILILRKRANAKKYAKIKELSPDVKEFEIKLPPFLELDYMVQLVSKDGSISNGVFTRVKGIHKNVILEVIEGKTVQIYFPPSYNIDKNRKYPVAYFYDGQNIFDRITSANGEWKVDETLDKLIEEDVVEEMIAVAIYADSERAKESVPYHLDNIDKPGAKDFSEFLRDKLIPAVDSKYRTIPNSENRAIIGSSFGGIFAFWAGYHYSDTFSTIGALSPSFWVEDGKVLEDVTSTTKPNVKIWMDRGTNEWIEENRTLVNLLKKKGFVYGKDLFYLEVKDGIHHESNWAKTVVNPLILFKGKNRDFISAKSIDVEEEIFTDWYREQHQFINPVLNSVGGISYSLLNSCTYEIKNSDAGLIMEDGTFIMVNGDDLKLNVKYREESVPYTISYLNFKAIDNKIYSDIKKEFLSNLKSAKVDTTSLYDISFSIKRVANEHDMDVSDLQRILTVLRARNILTEYKKSGDIVHISF